jgi:hypothetical protein
LLAADVRFVVVGGFALQLHGSSYATFDLDIAYERTRGIEGLIIAKRAAGRPKDEPGLMELEALREARRITDE